MSRTFEHFRFHLFTWSELQENEVNFRIFRLRLKDGRAKSYMNVYLSKAAVFRVKFLPLILALLSIFIPRADGDKI